MATQILHKGLKSRLLLLASVSGTQTSDVLRMQKKQSHKSVCVVWRSEVTMSPLILTNSSSEPSRM